MGDEPIGVKAHIEYKLEKYNAKGELEETIIREDEMSPEAAQEMKVIMDSLPDKAAEKEK